MTTNDPQINKLVDALFEQDVEKVKSLADSVLDYALLEAAWKDENALSDHI